MHELPIIQQVMDVVLDYAEQNHATEVRKVFLEIGVLHDLVPEWVQKYFVYAGKGTMAENAKLLISRPGLRIKCESCGKEQGMDIHDGKQPVCPDCGSTDFTIVSGNEFFIRGIEIQ